MTLVKSSNPLVQGPNDFSCFFCKFFVNIGIFLVNNDLQRIFNNNLLNLICSSFSSYNGESCDGLVDYYSNIIMDELFNGPLRADSICQNYFDSCTKTLAPNPALAI